jgi:2-polyprenyl-6-methoxyphenol hydroxylase-like FAD-dependent oxidoreductase
MKELFGKGIRVGVIGGSLGGLYTGLALRCIGCEVDIYERARGLMKDRGAGLVVHDEMLEYLEKYGIVTREAISIPIYQRRYLNRDGSVSFVQSARQRMTSWNVLFHQLKQAFPAENYHLGEEFVSFDAVGDQVTAQFASGLNKTFDLLICADGIHSVARSILIPGSQARYAGYVAWRGVVLESEVPPEVLDELVDHFTFYQYPNSHILTYLIPGLKGETSSGQRRINWVWYVNVQDGKALNDLLIDTQGNQRMLTVPEGLVRPEAISQIKAKAELDLPPVFQKLIQATKAPFIQAIHDMSVTRVVFGRVCLLGDAAFVVRPHTAASTYKASIAAITLSEAIQENKGNLKLALSEWEPIQIRLGQRLDNQGRMTGDLSQFGGSR